jgi:hypothetical protein
MAATSVDTAHSPRIPHRLPSLRPVSTPEIPRTPFPFPKSVTDISRAKAVGTRQEIRLLPWWLEGDTASTGSDHPSRGRRPVGHAQSPIYTTRTPRMKIAAVDHLAFPSPHRSSLLIADYTASRRRSVSAPQIATASQPPSSVLGPPLAALRSLLAPLPSNPSLLYAASDTANIPPFEGFCFASSLNRRATDPHSAHRTNRSASLASSFRLSFHPPPAASHSGALSSRSLSLICRPRRPPPALCKAKSSPARHLVPAPPNRPFACFASPSFSPPRFLRLPRNKVHAASLPPLHSASTSATSPHSECLMIVLRPGAGRPVHILPVPRNTCPRHP